MGILSGTAPAVNSAPPGVVCAAELLARGLALCRPDPGTKKPTYRRWPTFSLAADDFAPGCLYGILGGPLSSCNRPGHALVITDLDAAEAVGKADDFLPPTGMADGREGKPKDHRYFAVPLATVPEWALSGAPQAAAAARKATGHPGPFKKPFDAPDGRRLIDFIGTGGQVVCPSPGNQRRWTGGAPGEPAVVPFPHLWDAVSRLASTCADTHTPHDQTGQTDQDRPELTWHGVTCLILSSLPTGPGQRNRCVFELARRLKAVRPDATPAELRPILREWHRLALPHIRTKDFGESWSDFVNAWQNVRRPAGQSLAAAAAAADSEEPAIVDQLGYDGPLRRLAALCWQLARQWGDRPFPLGWEVAGRHLGVSTRHAGRLLKALRFDGVLQRVGKMGTKKSGRANEYRYLGTEGGGV